MYAGSLEERQIRNNEIKLVTAALYEAKIKDDEILRVLMKVCNVDKEEASAWKLSPKELVSAYFGQTDEPYRLKLTTVIGSN
ncbi:MAG: hypothetical protein ACYC00_21890 [Eubacteriales bacterium]